MLTHMVYKISNVVLFVLIMKVSQMRNRISGFQMFFCLCIYLCIFGSTKSQVALAALPAFDVSNSTVIEVEDSSLKVSKNKIIEPVTPPQPRNKRGDFVCTSNRYIQDEMQIGHASWYGRSFHGRPTASGEKFNQNDYTLAHLTLPMGTEVLVENPEKNLVIKARVNDCGPYVKGRAFDLSQRLAKDLGLLPKGGGTVIVTVL
jgi:rare lipoprotein A (peptidoglycan hydrolase)